MKDFAGAEKDVEEALEIAPDDVAVQREKVRIATLVKSDKIKEKAMYKKMFAAGNK